MLGLIRVDNQSFGFLGQQNLLPSLKQTSVTVHATRTVFELALPDTLSLTLTFLHTAFADDVFHLSRPVYYVTMDIRTLDGEPHDVKLYLDVTAQHVINQCLFEAVQWDEWEKDGLVGMQLGSAEQHILGQKCDACNINWGWLHLGLNSSLPSKTLRAGSALINRQQFIETGLLPAEKDTRQPRLCIDDLPALSVVVDLGRVGVAGPPSTVTVLLAYDDVEAIYYFGSEFKGLWAKNYSSIQGAMAAALAELPAMVAKSVAHDSALKDALEKSGGGIGAQYAALGALAYRQTLAALKPVWNDKIGDWWVFLKEISTNGDMQVLSRRSSVTRTHRRDSRPTHRQVMIGL
jgi:hypothetical protein